MFHVKHGAAGQCPLVVMTSARRERKPMVRRLIGAGNSRWALGLGRGIRGGCPTQRSRFTRKIRWSPIVAVGSHPSFEDSRRSRSISLLAAQLRTFSLDITNASLHFLASCGSMPYNVRIRCRWAGPSARVPESLAGRGNRVVDRPADLAYSTPPTRPTVGQSWPPPAVDDSHD